MKVKRTKEFLCKYEEQITYLIFGIMTTGVNWGVYVIFQYVFRIKLEVSNIVAWIVSVVFAYFTNKIFVFKSKTQGTYNDFKEFILFIGSRIATGFIEILGVPFLFYLGLNYELLNVEGLFAKIIISLIVIVANYILSKVIIFKKR